MHEDKRLAKTIIIANELRVKEEAQKRGLNKIELDVWAFNDAAAFYEAEGFKPYRTFLEYDV